MTGSKSNLLSTHNGLRLGLLLVVVWICGLYMGSNTGLLYHRDSVAFLSNFSERMVEFVPEPQHFQEAVNGNLDLVRLINGSVIKPLTTSPNHTTKLQTNAFEKTAQGTQIPNQILPALIPIGFVGHQENKTASAQEICSFPVLDPFDPALDKVLSRKKPLNCAAIPGQIPNVVRIENDVVHVDSGKVAQALKKDRTFLHCIYDVIRMKAGSDKAAKVALTRGTFNVSMEVNSEDEHIKIKCLDNNKTAFSMSYFSFIREEPSRILELDELYKAHVKKTKPKETFSIMLLGIDGFAKQHFARAMPKTRDFLIKEFGALELNKHSKLGYSTYPNVIKLLTGRNLYVKGWMDQINDAFIWSDAARRGYRTGFIMDQVEITAFHFLKPGFKNKPVDHYLRPPVVMSINDKLMRKKDRNCFGDEPEITKLLDYWLQLVTHYNSTRSNQMPFFAYSFMARLTHNDCNMAFAGDELYLKFLQDLKATNALNNTVIIWFSDHGERFGKLRHTYQGTIETNTPYTFFVFPPWFEKKYPQLMKAFKTNQDRLTTHSDTYATMKDLIDFTGIPGPKGTLSEHSISLFRDIPEERTCKDAQIPAEYCVCARFSKPELNPGLDNYLGMVVRDKIQSIIKPHAKQCAELRLASVESILEETEMGESDKKGIRTFRVSIMTEPGDALFEATLLFDSDRNAAKVVGEIARTNMYKGQAECMDNRDMRRYCYCKNLAKG